MDFSASRASALAAGWVGKVRMPEEIPETRYAKTVDGVHIAHQVVGDAPVDMVYLKPWSSHIE